MFKQIIQTLGLVKDFSNAQECYGKRWFTSKTLWVNAIAMIAFWLNWKFKAIVIPDELQAQIVATGLGILNVLLRVSTTQPVVTKEANIICMNPEDSK